MPPVRAEDKAPQTFENALAINPLGLIFAGALGALNLDVDYNHRMNQYTSLSAEIRYKKGKKTSFNKALLSSIWAFIRSYFIRAGFLDGKMGFVVAVSSAESSYYRHLKLLEMWKTE